MKTMIQFTGGVYFGPGMYASLTKLDIWSTSTGEHVIEILYKRQYFLTSGPFFKIGVDMK